MPERIPQPVSLAMEQEPEHAQTEPTTAAHPDRQILIDNPVPADDEPPKQEVRPIRPPIRKPKAQPFKREHEDAQKRKAEAEERRNAREEAERQRHVKLEERERFRRAMAKARTGGRNGQRKLGRESNVLLEKVKRLVSEGG